MRFDRYIEKLRRVFAHPGQPALCWIRLRGSAEIIESAELLRVERTFLEIGHGGLVQLVPIEVIERISVYDVDD